MQLLAEHMSLMDVGQLPCQMSQGGLLGSLTAGPARHFTLRNEVAALLGDLSSKDIDGVMHGQHS